MYTNFTSAPTTSFPTNNHAAPLSHKTLQQIDELLQDDVVMQPVGERPTCLVMDTNILLDHLGMLQRFTEDVEKRRLPILLIIPGAVLNELDGLKKNERLGWFARRVSEWILAKLKERNKGQTTSVRGQINSETCKPSGNWRIRQPGEEFGPRGNDELILDCCIYFQKQGYRIALCSADINLTIECKSQGISFIAPKSGRDLARFVLGHDIWQDFAGYEAEYTGNDSAQDDNDMMMDVDGEERVMSVTEKLDSLHNQVVDHFTRLLVELVGRVGGPALEDWYPGAPDGASASRYAPKWKSNKKPYTQWTAAECLEYLNERKRQKPSSPRLDRFLTRRHSVAADGSTSRSGKDWSYADWKNALDALKRVGDDWDEGSIREDLHELACHREAVFGITRV
ncbi:PIN domain-containing protein [Roridomyces roridus]|uniref:PIN domain-containing protein n=1 Tax=Roridomyces roridus TaxID=1738132 RepID=A0AAD7C4Z6_9AGAR|nr:PIN domain-containing protein [Roridomyces roridus]